jgi:undecaprenyl diphosphate synthase
MKLSEKIDASKLPVHVAIIMDGNGRWAKKRGLPRVFGHREGAKTVKKTIETASDLGIKVLTLYAFSTENWIRPAGEIGGLMSLLQRYLKAELKSMLSNDIKFMVSGDITKFSAQLQNVIEDTKAKTSGNKGLVLNLALNYGGRQEILSAVNKLVKKGRKAITEEELSSFLYTSELPEPDLFIRTSGEYRLSNFLLWQLAYTELYFTDVLWPDFDKEEFFKAVLSYQSRQRRFGGV